MWASFLLGLVLLMDYPFQSSEIITEAAQWPRQSDSRAHAFENSALLWVFLTWS